MRNFKKFTFHHRVDWRPLPIAIFALMAILFAIFQPSSTYAETVAPAPVHAHKYEARIIHPTCTTVGYTLFYCECGDSHTTDYVRARGHRYNQSVNEATCVENGYVIYTCRCGSCYREETQLAKGHVYQKTVIPPTCTEEGYTVYTCSCGDSYRDDAVPAIGHDYKKKIIKPTCTEDGYTIYTCHCGDSYTTAVTEKLGHSYSEKVVKATYKSKGYVLHTCSVCDHSYKDSYTDKLTVSEEIESRSGMIGRLTIPDVGVNVALFLSTPTSNKTQAIVDKKDSAALVDIEYYGGYNALFGKYYIADHNNQGFNAIKKAVPGATHAFIDFGSYTAKYLCTQNFVGRNNGNGFSDKDGNKISICNSSDGIMMYTCNSQKPYITITYWERVG